MFISAAIVLIFVIGWYARYSNERDRSVVETLSDEEVRTAVLHARQDLKLIAFLLGGVLFMLGVIAERMH
jgi:hypothetical protein